MINNSTKVRHSFRSAWDRQFHHSFTTLILQARRGPWCHQSSESSWLLEWPEKSAVSFQWGSQSHAVASCLWRFKSNSMLINQQILIKLIQFYIGTKIDTVNFIHRKILERKFMIVSTKNSKQHNCLNIYNENKCSMICEWSCDTEDWNNGCWKFSFIITEINNIWKYISNRKL